MSIKLYYLFYVIRPPKYKPSHGLRLSFDLLTAPNPLVISMPKGLPGPVDVGQNRDRDQGSHYILIAGRHQNKKGVPISCVAPRTPAKGHKRTAPSRHSLFKEARFLVPLRLFKNLEDSGGGFSWKRLTIILSNPALLASLCDATLNPRICSEQLRPDTWHFGAPSVCIGARFAG